MAQDIEHVFNGRYRVEGRLGTGGMAIVYSGTDLLLRRRVAIKVLRDQFVSDDGFVARFSNEAQSAAKLSHPNIVNVYDFGHEGEAYYIVMELVEGETLADLLRDGETIPESVAIDYATQIAAGLAYAHRQGLLHRDVKPANVLITSDDVVKLSDFGIARAVSENAAGVTQPGMVMGSVAYVSPEQATGIEQDERSDLYSLGVVLFQMISGYLPFEADTPVAVAFKHVAEPAPPIDPGTGVSPALAAIVERLLAKAPADRFASATELARALREARERPAQTPVRAATGDAPTASFGRVGAPQPPPRRSSAPDGPAGAALPEPPPVRAAARRRGGAWRIPFLALLFAAAIAAGYYGMSAFAPARDIVVDDYRSASATQAQQRLAAAGLRTEVRLETNGDVPVDRVIRQNPAAGTRLASAETVTLVVSSGPPSAAVPDVKGFVRTDAERALGTARFRTRVVPRFDAAPKDTVVDVLPGSGAQVPEGSTITLVVSRGPMPVHVPQLVGLTVGAARAQLEKLGLKLNIDQQTPSDVIPKDTIASQGVSPDATVDPGSVVGVTVSAGATPATVPDVLGKPALDAGAALVAAGFVTRVQFLVDPSNANGSVTAQDPAAGATAARRSTVTINVAVAGTVPDVSGMALDDAERALGRSGYSVGALTLAADGSDGKVVRTDPAAGASLRPGEPVAIVYHATGTRR